MEMLGETNAVIEQQGKAILDCPGNIMIRKSILFDFVSQCVLSLISTATTTTLTNQQSEQKDVSLQIHIHLIQYISNN